MPDLPRGWLLGSLGSVEHRRWSVGVGWRRGGTYVVLEASPARTASRRDPHAGSEGRVASYLEDAQGFEVELVVP